MIKQKEHYVKAEEDNWIFAHLFFHFGMLLQYLHLLEDRIALCFFLKLLLVLRVFVTEILGKGSVPSHQSKGMIQQQSSRM